MATDLPSKQERTLSVFESGAPGEPLATSEVAENLDCSRRTAYNRLERLADQEELETKKIGAKGRVWWRPPDRSTAGTESGASPDTDRDRVFSTLVENLPGMAYRCRNEPEWRMSFVSEGCRELIGYDPEALETDAVVWGEDVLHPDDRERVWDVVQAALDEREPFTLTYRIRRKDGTVRWVWEQGQGVYDDGDLAALEGYITDVTDRETRERRLRQSKRRFDAVFDDPETFIGLLDTDGTVSRVNRSALEFVGADLDDVEGEPFWETPWWTHSSDLQDDLREWIDRAAAGEYVEFEATHRSEGEEIVSSGVARPVEGDDGEVVSVLVECRDVTERRERERQFDAVFNQTYQYMGLLAPDGTVLRVNDASLEFGGVDREAVVGRPAWETPWWSDDERLRSKLEDAVARAAEGEFVRFETEIDGDDDTAYVDFSLKPVTGEDGQVESLVAEGRNISHRKERERRLQEFQDRAEELVRVPGEELPEVATQIAEEVLELPVSGVYLLSEDGQRLEPAAATDAVRELFDEPSAYERGADRVPGESLVWEAFDTGDPIYVDDTHEHEAFEGADVLARSGLVYPLGDHGVFLAMSTEPGVAGATNSALVELLATNLTAALDRAERERQLQRSEQRYRELLESAPVPMGVLTEDDGVVYANSAVVEFVDADDRKELLGRSPTEFVAEEGRDDVRRRLRTVFEERETPGRAERRFVTSDGEERIGQVAPVPVTYEGQDAAQFVIEDVTERKDRERELEAARQFNEELVENAPFGMFRLDEQLRITYENPRAREIVGLPEEESTSDAVGIDIRDVPSIVDTGQAEMFSRLQDGETIDFEFPFESIYGREAYFTGRGVPLYREGEFDGAILMVTDITDQKDRERELEAARQFNEELVENAPFGMFRLDEQLRITYENSRAQEIIGLPEDKEESDAIGVDFRELPPVVETGEAERFSALLEGETVEFEFPFESIYGKEAYFTGRAVPLYREGEFDGAILMATDISERRRRERELERERDRRASLFENSPDPVVEIEYVDETPVIEGVNPAFEDTFGFAAADVVDQSVIETVVPEDRHDAHERIWDRVIAGDPVEEEVRRRTADGERDFLLRIIPVEVGDASRGAYAWLADITDRKEHERRLQAFQARTEELIRAPADEVPEVATQIASEVLDLSLTGVYLLNQDEEWLEPVAATDRASEVLGELEGYRRDSGDPAAEIAWQAFETGEDVFVEDVYEHEELSGEGAGRSGLVHPLGDHGVLVATSPETEAFDATDRAFADLLATNLTAALDRAEGERQLRRSEQRYRRLLEHSPGPVFIYAEDATLVYANDAAVDLLGAEDRSQLLGTPAGKFAHEDDIQTVAKRHRRLVEDREPAPPVEEKLVDVEGNVKYVRLSSTPVTFEGDPAIQTVATDLTDRKRQERRLERRREQLARVNRLNALFNESTHAIVEADDRSEIETAVCDRLANADPYLGGWIGHSNGDDVAVHASGGLADVDGDDPDDPVAPSRVAASEALATNETQARTVGDVSVAATPVVYDERSYGVLVTYTDRDEAFDDHERTVVSRLGELIGHGIAALDRKQALMAEQVVELEFDTGRLDYPLADATAEHGGRIKLDRVVPITGDSNLLYYAVEDMPAESFVDAVESVEDVSRVRSLDRVGTADWYEVRIDRQVVASRVASQGGRVREGVIENGHARLVAEVPEGHDVRGLVDSIQKLHPDFDLVSRRTIDRSNARSLPRLAVEERLTDRQRSVLEAAFFSGYFERPRQSTGEDVATALDISAATFHEHLRIGERKLLAALFDAADVSDI